MNVRENQKKLFEALVRIKDEINQQIIHVPNHFPEFDRPSWNLDWNGEEKAAFIEEVDRKYFVHEKEFAAAKVEADLYKKLKSFLEEFQRQLGKSVNDFNEKEKKRFIDEFKLESANLFSRHARQVKYSVYRGVKSEELSDIFDEKIEELAGVLLRGEAFVPEKNKYSDRLQLFTRLSEVRDQIKKEQMLNLEVLLQAGDRELKTKIEKHAALWSGAYLKKNYVRIGLCDEHKCLALVKILEARILKEEMKVEVISIRYSDEDDKLDDGHTFLIINRDPKSILSQPLTWGETAIIFDAWNQLVCYAADLGQQPYYYSAFPDGAEWAVIAEYDRMDQFHGLESVSKLIDYYAITGNAELENRIVRIMEEFHLNSLDQDYLFNTKQFLYQMAKEMLPIEFAYLPEIFITTGKKCFIQIIPGFDQPKIAIHAEFGNYLSVEELQFGFAAALMTIKQYWVGLKGVLSLKQQIEMNQKAIEVSQNGPAAISYLRKSYDFYHKDYQDYENDSEMDYVYAEGELARDFLGEIKAFTTLFALDQFNYINTKDKATAITSIPGEINSELVKIPHTYFYQKGFDSKPTRLEKIYFLIDCLNDLHIELFPFELSDEPSVRLKEFCRLLRNLKINFEDRAERLACDYLIDQAFYEKIPGFYPIYMAAHGSRYYKRFTYRGGYKPLGVFNKLQSLIDAFINTETMEGAKKQAEQFNELFVSLKPHFKNNCSKYFGKYQEKNNGKLPKGEARYFGSEIGKFIDWTGFKDDKNAEPWKALVGFAHQDSTGVIAQMLWHLGLKMYEPLWPAFKPIELLRLFQNERIKSTIQVFSKGCYDYHYPYHGDEFYAKQAELIAFISSRHVLQSDFFEKASSFIEGFNQFFDVNWPMLVYPNTVKDNPNMNNKAVEILLAQFSNILDIGTVEEKQVVRDFFDQRIDGRTLGKLCFFVKGQTHANLRNDSPYIKFLFESFEPEEVLTFLTYGEYHYYSIHSLEPLELAKLYRMPYTVLNAECMQELIPRVMTLEINYEHGCFKKYFDNNKLFAFSSETAIMLRLLNSTNYFSRSGMHTQIDWGQLEIDSHLAHLSLEDFIYLYRYYDDDLKFPSIEIKQTLSKQLFLKICEVKEGAKLIKYILSLLLQKSQSPLTDLELRNDLINFLTVEVLKQYGKDDGSKKYEENIKSLIVTICTLAAKRDKFLLLEKLTTSIEAQWKVCKLISPLVEPDKYFQTSHERVGIQKNDLDGLTTLITASRFFSKDKNDQHAFLDFLSAPLTNETTTAFEDYLIKHDKVQELFNRLNYHFSSDNRVKLRELLHSLYHTFWDCNLERRAVLIEYIIIPIAKVKTDEQIEQSFEEGYLYIIKKLLPNADDPNSDEHFARALVKAYLTAADKYTRSILLAGMLVASNESSGGVELSVGKKIVMLCEHLGPAYIKFAQAIHSHPHTPEYLRKDLEHLKGRAHPPYRWEIWRLLKDVVPKTEYSTIKHVGPLLGSASYNLALDIELHDGRRVVLILLRENARKDSKKGFDHLTKTINLCDHERLRNIKEAILSIIEQARLSSEIEMDKEDSAKQYEMADKIYSDVGKIIRTNLKTYSIAFHPAILLQSGYGYRFTQLVYGDEFNYLPAQTAIQKDIRKAIALAVMEVELTNILSGGHFDCDRHGNQLRANVDLSNGNIELGLYDFGEMSLALPKIEEIKQLASLINDIPNKLWNKGYFSHIMESLLSDYIDKAREQGQSTSYLMRIRKGLLALQDFQKELTTTELFSILYNIKNNHRIHPEIKTALEGLSVVELAINAFAGSVMSFFGRVTGEISASFLPSKKM